MMHNRLLMRSKSLAICIAATLVITMAWRVFPHPAIFLAIGILPLATLFVLWQPFLMVLLFVIFSFFRIHEVFPQLYNLKIPLLLSLASLSALLWHIGISGTIKIYWRPELTAICVFFILVLIGVVAASNRSLAFEYSKAIYWKIIIMTFAIAWLARTERDFTLVSSLITVFGMLVGLVALYNKYQGIGLVEDTRVTISRDIGSVLGDPNDLALVLMFPIAFASSMLLTRSFSRPWQLLGLLSLVVLFFAILATQSRGGLLGMLAIFAVYAYRRIPSKLLFICLGAVAAASLFMMAGISGRASGGAAEVGIDESAMGRIYAWQAAFRMAVEHPLTGVGINNFYANYFFYSPHWDGLNHAVHSTWFGVLAETGFLGLIIFLTAMAMLIRTSILNLNHIEQHRAVVSPAIYATAQAVCAGLLGTVVSATFLTQSFTWPIYILAALVVALAQWRSKHLPPFQP